MQRRPGQPRKFSAALRADLIEHAEYAFALDRHRAGKGDKPAGEAPVLPAAGAHIWRWFIDLSRRERTYAGMAGCPMPLRSADIEAWERKSGIRITPSEIGHLRALDDVWIGIMTASEDKGRGGQPPLTEDGELDRVQVAQDLKKALSMFKKQ